MSRLLVLMFFIYSLFTIHCSLAGAEEKIKLEEVVVTATKTETLAENVAQDVTVITKEEIENSSAKSVTDTLKNVMGIQIREYGNRGASSSASLRGSTSAQVLVLIDGKRLNKPTDGQVDLNTLSIPPENIERIEILRGASSSLYGADAMGGVVNIITKMPSEPVTSLSTSFGRFDTRNFWFSTSRKVGQVGYLFSANREESSGFRENSDYELWGMNSKLTFDLSKDFHIDFNADYNHRDAGAPGHKLYPSPLARQKDENTMFGITFRIKDTIAKLYNHNSRIGYVNPAFLTDSTHKNHIYGADLQSSILIGSSNLITGGIELISEEVDSTIIGSKGRTRKGIFIQDEISMLGNVIFNIGLRYDDFDKGNQLTPKAAILYKVAKDTSIRFSAGKGYRIPTLNDLYWNEDWGSGMGMFGNPDLKPEKATEYEASVEQIFNKNIRARVLVFQKDVKDLIKWQQKDAFGSLWMVENIDKARIRGFELNSQLNLDILNLEASYYYQDPKDRNTGKRIYALQRHQISGILSVYPFKETTVSLEGRYVSHYVMSGNPKWCYFVLDGKLSKKFPTSFGKGEIFIIGKNILDRDFETSRGFPMPPVQFIGGLSLSF